MTGAGHSPLVSAIDWSRVGFTEHMVEAAVVVAECQVAFDFEGNEQACWDVKVCRVLKGCLLYTSPSPRDS